MRKFLRDKHLLASEFPSEMAHFSKLLDDAPKPKGTLLETTKAHELYSSMIACASASPESTTFERTDMQVPLPPIRKAALDQEASRELDEMYREIYPEDELEHVELIRFMITVHQQYSQSG